MPSRTFANIITGTREIAISLIIPRGIGKPGIA